MRRLALIALLVLVAPLAAHAQEPDPPDGTPIASALVSGFDLRRLSPGLQQAIRALASTPLHRQRLQELAARIEAERPGYVAAVRVEADADGRARVSFVVAAAGAPAGANINAKYIVDDVDVHGVDAGELDAAITGAIAALIGKPLDVDAAERLAQQLRDAFPSYDVEQRHVRGDTRGRIRVVYSLRPHERQRWLRYEPTGAHSVYHSDQGWGMLLPLSIGSRDTMVMPLFAWGTSEHGIEHYSGFGLRLESRRLGTDRLGLSLEWSSFDQHWRDETLTASGLRPDLPPLYRHRRTVTPLVKFAITPQLSVAAGVRVSELTPLATAPVGTSAAANAFTGSLRYRHPVGPSQEVNTTLTWKAGRAALDSDFVYDHYVAHVGYTLHRGSQHLLISGTAGRVDDTAPLFDRFALGDAHTLRGWDKFAITPLGGTRLAHAALEYRTGVLQVFVDAGSVWDAGAARRLRVSTGLGIAQGPAFLTVAFPLSAGRSGAVVITGIRTGFSAVGISRR